MLKILEPVLMHYSNFPYKLAWDGGGFTHTCCPTGFRMKIIYIYFFFFYSGYLVGWSPKCFYRLS